MSIRSMHDAAIDFVRAVKASEEYREYTVQLEKIKKQPELFERVNAFRRKNFQIQNTEDSEKLLDRMDELDEEYEQLREIPMAGDFFDAETSFCRMMQDIDIMIIRELDFQ